MLAVGRVDGVREAGRVAPRIYRQATGILPDSLYVPPGRVLGVSSFSTERADVTSLNPSIGLLRFGSAGVIETLSTGGVGLADGDRRSSGIIRPVPRVLPTAAQMRERSYGRAHCSAGN